VNNENTTKDLDNNQDEHYTPTDELKDELKKCIKRKYTAMRCKWMRKNERRECEKRVAEYCKKYIKYRFLKKKGVFRRIWLIGLGLTTLGIITYISNMMLFAVLNIIVGLPSMTYGLYYDFKKYEEFIK